MIGRTLVAAGTTAVLAALPFATAFGGAGPPLVTDDPGTPGDGHWEINLAATYDRRPGEDVAELPLVDLNYGVGERVQLKYEVARLVEHEDGARQSGLGNSQVGVKWRFYDAGEEGLAISMYPQVEFNNPGSSDDEQELAGRGTTWILPLQLQQRWKGIDWNVELGRSFHRTGDEWRYGFAASGNVTQRLELAAELAGQATPGFQRTALFANVGARFTLNDRFTVLAALGREIHNGIEEPASLKAYLALQVVIE